MGLPGQGLAHVPVTHDSLVQSRHLEIDNPKIPVRKHPEATVQVMTGCQEDSFGSFLHVLK